MIRDMGFTLEYGDDIAEDEASLEEDQSGLAVTRSATLTGPALTPAE